MPASLAASTRLMPSSALAIASIRSAARRAGGGPPPPPPPPAGSLHAAPSGAAPRASGRPGSAVPRPSLPPARRRSREGRTASPLESQFMRSAVSDDAYDPPGHWLAAGSGGAAADKGTLRHRDGGPRPFRRGATRDPAG